MTGGTRTTPGGTVLATLTFVPSGETIEVPAGTSLLDAAIMCELDVPAPCAGQGRCRRRPRAAAARPRRDPHVHAGRHGQRHTG